MIQLLINPNDPRYIFLVGSDLSDMSQLRSLEKHMNKIPQYMLLPTYNGIPMAEVFLDKFKREDKWIYYCSAGLWKEVLDFFKSNKWQISSQIDNSFKYTEFSLSKEEFKELVDSWDLNIEPRPYQYDAAWLILKYKLSLSELATRAGKTLILYMVARAAKEVLGVRKILMIVPSIHLVKQGAKDLSEYKDYFSAEQIWANGEEVELADFTIGTFQSLVRKADPRYEAYNPDWFNGFDMVCVDEAHKAPCKSIKKILALEAFKHLKLRFGFTGTLPKPNTIEWFACQAILGPKIQEISARDLIEEGFLADPIIRQFRLVYNPETLQDITIKCAEYLLSSYRKVDGKHVKLPKDQCEFTITEEKVLPTALRESKRLCEPHEYIQYLTKMLASSSKTLFCEQLMAMFSQNRIDLICQIIKDLNKNVIIFAHNTEYIKHLEHTLAERFPDRQVNKITGATTLKSRQKLIGQLANSDNNILIGSYGVIGTGLTIPNLYYGVFGQSFKADTINRQSLGRLMLRTADKPEFYLYDIIDVFPTKKLYNQALEKVKIYKSEGHRHEVIQNKCDYKNIHRTNKTIHT